MEKETLEEAALEVYPVFMELGHHTIEHDSNIEFRDAFITGAKWQAERDKDELERKSYILGFTDGANSSQGKYTEENIIDILLEYTFSNECFEIREGMCSGFEKEEILRWFEQYKKEKL